MPQHNALEAATAHVLAQDAELQQRVKGLVKSMLDEAERQMKYAPPATRLDLVRSMLPTIIKEARAHEADDRLADLQTQIKALHEAVRADVAEAGAVHPAAIPPTDSPRPHLSVIDNTITRVSNRG